MARSPRGDLECLIAAPTDADAALHKAAPPRSVRTDRSLVPETRAFTLLKAAAFAPAYFARALMREIRSTRQPFPRMRHTHVFHVDYRRTQ